MFEMLVVRVLLLQRFAVAKVGVGAARAYASF